jgi:propionyl-CoA carboxylase alpha chain
VVGKPRGHCVQARLYAEDPAAGFAPQTGVLTAFDVPGGVRVDAGVEAGDEISTFYDAMIAKVVAWAPTRDEALRKLAGSLRRATIHGVTTNRDLLVDLLGDEVLTAGRMHTSYLDGRKAAEQESPVQLHGFAAAVALATRRQQSAPVQSRLPAGWRNVVSQPQVTTFLHGGAEIDVRWYGGRTIASADLDVTVISATPSAVVLERDGVRVPFSVAHDGDRIEVDSPLGHVALVVKPRFVDPSAGASPGSLLAPMPGSVVAVAVAVGESVERGQPILVLEAMKMQYTVAAPHAGVVNRLAAAVGTQVAAGDVLAMVEEAR